MQTRPDCAFYDLHLILPLLSTLRSLDPTTAPCAVVVSGAGDGLRSIGAVPGSFNPLTDAHSDLLEAVRDAASLDGVFYVLAAQIVDKEAVTGLTLVDRLVCLTLDSSSRVHAGVLLVNRGLYVDQAEAIRSAFPNCERLWFAVGFDKIVQIFDRKYYQDRDAALNRLFSLASFAVAPRGTSDARSLTNLLDRPENQPYRAHVVALATPPEVLTLSSTEVRAALAGGANAERLLAQVPTFVSDFIRTTGVYEPPFPLGSGEIVDRYLVRSRWIEALATRPDWAMAHADLRFLVASSLADNDQGRALRKWLNQVDWSDVIRVVESVG